MGIFGSRQSPTHKNQNSQKYNVVSRNEKKQGGRVENNNYVT